MKQYTIPHFKSFVWAGYECTYAKTEIRERLDMLEASGHDKYCRQDYALITPMEVQTVREGLSWHQIDKGNGEYDFSRFEKIMQIGKEAGVQQIWDLNHFDFPDYVDPFSEEFVLAFAEYARRALCVIRKYQEKDIYICPVNEISFFSWIGADRGVWAPYTKGRNNGFAFKKQLVKAAIAAMKALWKEDASVRFVHPDPFMRRIPLEPIEWQAVDHCRNFNEIVRFEAWDMICGKSCPELGGDSQFLDIVGINYYFHNQEYVLSKPDGTLGFEAMDFESSARVSFSEMIADVYNRYRKPIVVSETGSFGNLRAAWWKRLLPHIKEGLEKGLPIFGVCSYPTIDRPDAINYLLRRSGLWDFEDDDPLLLRVPHRETLAVIEEFSKEMNKHKHAKR